MSFSICLNKNEMLTLCGLSLLYQGLDLKQEGKLMQDGQRLVNVVVRYLEKAKAPGASDFKRLTATMLNQEISNKPEASPSVSTKATPSPPTARKHLQPQLYRHNSMSESDLLSQQEKLRRATISNLAAQSSQQESFNYGRSSLDTVASKTAVPRRDYRNSISQLPAVVKPQTMKTINPPNLDYLSLNNTPAPSQVQSPTQTRLHQSVHNTAYSASVYPNNNKTSTATASEWEVLVGSFDDRHLYDAIYGGGPPQAVAVNEAVNTNLGDWSADSWDYTSLGMDSFTNAAPPPTSVLSFSDESLSSGDDLSASDLGLSALDNKPVLVAGNVPNDGYDYLLEGLDRTHAIFGL